ncbi:unnamed protein product, partial [marine sediment metagenome]
MPYGRKPHFSAATFYTTRPSVAIKSYLPILPTAL